MDSSSLTRSPDKHAQKLLSSTSFPCSPSISLSDPLLAPAGERPIHGPSSVKAALALEHLFRQTVRVRAADFDEGTRVLALETASTWALPVVGLLRLESEGRTEIFLEDGAEGLVVGRIVNSESMDVVTAEALPKALAYPIALSLTLLLPLLGSLIVVITHASSHVRRVARRRPSGPVAAVINPLDTGLIVLALMAVCALNVVSWAAGCWKGLVGDKGIVVKVSLDSDKKNNSKDDKVIASSGMTSAIKAKRTSSSSAVSSRAKQSENRGTTSPAASSDKHTELGLDERYPHHEHVVEDVSLAGAINSGLAGLDERVPADAGKPTQNGSGNGQAEKTEGEGESKKASGAAPSSTEERYPHHDHVVKEVSFKDAIKSGVEGLDPKVPTESSESKQDGQDGADEPASKPSKADKEKSKANGNKAASSDASATEESTASGDDDERYPHHDHVVEEIKFADAVKSGVAGLDERVSVDGQ